MNTDEHGLGIVLVGSPAEVSTAVGPAESAEPLVVYRIGTAACAIPGKIPLRGYCVGTFFWVLWYGFPVARGREKSS